MKYRKVCGMIFALLVAVQIIAAPMYDRRTSSGSIEPPKFRELQGGVIISWDVVSYGDTLYRWQEILVPVNPTMADIQKAMGSDEIPFELNTSAISELYDVEKAVVDSIAQTVDEPEGSVGWVAAVITALLGGLGGGYILRKK